MQQVAEDPIRLAVIGAGKASRAFHLPNLKRLQDEGIYRLETICDLNPTLAKSAQQQYGFKQSTHNAQDPINQDDINAVCVFGSAQLHYEYGYQILRAGKHLFVEKPPAPTAQHLLRLYRLAKEKSLIAAVGFNRRFHHGYLLLKDFYHNSAEIMSLEAVFHKNALTAPVPYGARSWLSANSIHAVDVLCDIAGKPPEELYCFRNELKAGHPQNFSAIMKWDSHAHAVLCCNNTAGTRTERYTVHLAGRSSYWEDNHVHIDCDGSSQDFAFEATLENLGFYGEHWAFADAIRTRRTPTNQMRNGVVALRLVEKMEEGHNGALDWEEFFSQENSLEDEELDRLMTRDTPGERQGSILIYNPDTLGQLLSEIQRKYDILYPDMLDNIPETRRSRVEAIITGRGGEAISDDVLDTLPSVKVVGVVGASVKNYNAAKILERKIPIINADDSYAYTVAEFCVMLALIGIRNASRSHELMRNASRSRKKPGLKRRLKLGRKMLRRRLAASVAAFRPSSSEANEGTEYRKGWYVDQERQNRAVRELTYQAKGGRYNLRNATVGLFGFGDIARRFIELLKPFECDVAVYSRYFTSEEAEQLGVRKATLSEVLSSQIVSLHRGLSPSTRRSFGENEIECLRPGAVLINTARGELIDTPALIRRLERNDIFACLDVFDEEPLPLDSRLRELPNVFLTSHIAGSTDQMYEEAAEELVRKVLAFLEGQCPDTVIQSEELLANMT